MSKFDIKIENATIGNVGDNNTAHMTTEVKNLRIADLEALRNAMVEKATDDNHLMDIGIISKAKGVLEIDDDKDSFIKWVKRASAWTGNVAKDISVNIISDVLSGKI